MLLQGIFSLVLCSAIVHALPAHSDSRKIYCFRSCFANLVLTSPFVGSKLADSMCPAFKSLPNCLYKCDRSLMRETAVIDMMSRCKARESRLKRYRTCVDSHLPAAFNECSRSCVRKKQSTNSIFEEINAHCRKIKCRLPCTITELNKRCNIAGNHIFGTYAIPYDAMVTVMERNKNLKEALIGMPKQCRFLFDLNNEDTTSMDVDWDDWKKSRNFADVPEETTTAASTTTAVPTTTAPPSTTTHSHRHKRPQHFPPLPRGMEFEMEADNLLEVREHDASPFELDEA